MELIEKLKEYVKVLEKAHDMYAKNHCYAYWAGMRDGTQACINDLKRMIEENKKLKDTVSKNVVKVNKTNSGKVVIKPTPYADTRTIETDITEEMLMSDTLKHIEAVNNLLNHSALKLIEAGKVHDRTKIGEDFDAFFKIIKSGKTGEDFFKSRWYKKHIREERHHINSRVPKKVNLFDVLEMIADVVAAGLARTGKVYPVDLTDEVLQEAVKNTVTLLISESETVEKEVSHVR